MSERDRPGRAPEGSSFAPGPGRPGSGRAPTLVAAIVIAVVVGGFVLAQLNPPEEPAQAVVQTVAPTESAVPVTPAPTATLPQPTATALPAREWFTAPEAPMMICRSSPRTRSAGFGWEPPCMPTNRWRSPGETS